MNPGIYEISPEVYHSDSFTPEPALSHSGIVTLLNETPAHFAARNPRLSEYPDAVEREATKEQDLGSAIHRLILGKGADIYVVSGFDDWRKKEAQAARDEARANGLTPMLERQFMQAQGVAERAAESLKARFGGWPIGRSEVALFWRRETAHGPIWARALADHFSERTRTVLDIKTTARCIGDDDLARKFAGDGADVQAAWYLEGAEAIVPAQGLWQFIDCVVEVDAPFSIRYARFSEGWLTRARYRCDRAANLFAECLRKNSWPAWTSDATLQVPGYLAAKWEQEEMIEATA